MAVVKIKDLFKVNKKVTDALSKPFKDIAKRFKKEEPKIDPDAWMNLTKRPSNYPTIHRREGTSATPEEYMHEITPEFNVVPEYHYNRNNPTNQYKDLNSKPMPNCITCPHKVQCALQNDQPAIFLNDKKSEIQNYEDCFKQVEANRIVLTDSFGASATHTVTSGGAASQQRASALGVQSHPNQAMSSRQQHLDNSFYGIVSEI